MVQKQLNINIIRDLKASVRFHLTVNQWFMVGNLLQAYITLYNVISNSLIFHPLKQRTHRELIMVNLNLIKSTTDLIIFQGNSPRNKVDKKTLDTLLNAAIILLIKRKNRSPSSKEDICNHRSLQISTFMDNISSKIFHLQVLFQF